MVVKTLVPFWIPIIIPHLIFRVPTKGPLSPPILVAIGRAVFEPPGTFLPAQAVQGTPKPELLDTCTTKQDSRTTYGFCTVQGLQRLGISLGLLRLGLGV